MNVRATKVKVKPRLWLIMDNREMPKDKGSHVTSFDEPLVCCAMTTEVEAGVSRYLFAYFFLCSILCRLYLLLKEEVGPLSLNRTILFSLLFCSKI